MPRRYSADDAQARGGGAAAELLHASCRDVTAASEVERHECRQAAQLVLAAPRLLPCRSR
jgi:hypothetical protein